MQTGRIRQCIMYRMAQRCVDIMNVKNVENKICGATDIALTELGHKQAVETGKKILEQGIKADEILYSPLIRAKDTALHIAEITGIPAREEARLKEQNFGKYESTPRDGAEFREAKKQFVNCYEGGESMLHLAQRIYNLLDEVAASDKTYILVAHNGIARVVQSYFYEMTNEEYAAFGVSPEWRTFMLGKRKGKQRREYVRDYVLYDLETTGISSLYDEVIEISAVKVRNGKIVDEFSELVNPGRPIPYAASSVNNISDKMVENARSFEKVLPEFLAFAGDDVLAGHNIAGFDMKFLYRDCEKYFGQTLTNDYIDTLAIAKLCFPEWKHRKLSDLAEHYGISTKGAHRALADCRMNQQVFELMAKESGGTSAKQTEEKICPRCGLALKKRNGRFGGFWGCTGFPDCRYTENV